MVPRILGKLVMRPSACYLGQRQAPVPGPDGSFVSSRDAEIMLLSGGEWHSGEGRRRRRSSPELVPTQMLPSRSISTFQTASELSPWRVVKLSPGELSIAWGVVHCSTWSNLRRPLSLTAQMQPSGGEGKVSESNILWFPYGGSGKRTSTFFVGHTAESVIVGKPDGAIRRLMEKGVMVRRSQNKGGRGCAGVVFQALESGLPQRHKEKRAIERSHPDGSFTVYQDGRGKAHRGIHVRADLSQTDPRMWNRPPDVCSHNPPSGSSAIPSICSTGVQRRSV